MANSSPNPALPASITFYGFRIDCENMSDSNDPGRGVWVDCWISKNGDSASLACAEDNGELNEGTPVSEKVLERAREFAERFGY